VRYVSKKPKSGLYNEAASSMGDCRESGYYLGKKGSLRQNGEMTEQKTSYTASGSVKKGPHYAPGCWAVWSGEKKGDVAPVP